MKAEIRSVDMRLVRVHEKNGVVTVVFQLEEGRHSTINVFEDYVKVTSDRVKKEAK
jgi:hypothetical protein